MTKHQALIVGFLCGSFFTALFCGVVIETLAPPSENAAAPVPDLSEMTLGYVSPRETYLILRDQIAKLEELSRNVKINQGNIEDISRYLGGPSND